MPTLALVNAISFRQMDDPSKHFSGVRVWGTVGWIVSGQIYTDSKSGGEHKSAAQGLITLATYGIGMLIGFSVAARRLSREDEPLG